MGPVTPFRGSSGPFSRNLVVVRHCQLRGVCVGSTISALILVAQGFRRVDCPGRPKDQAPKGRVAVREAAKILGVSESAVRGSNAVEGEAAKLEGSRVLRSGPRSLRGAGR